MRSPHHLLLALASLLGLVLTQDVPFSQDHGLGFSENGRRGNSGLEARYPLPAPQCDAWVGVEMIIMIEVTEVCPDGSTVTETITECVGTLTRSICVTATTNRPCYPCVMGTPPASDTATVTMTSCSTATEQTITITAQLCSTCSATTYTGTVPGYTPGGPCHGCTSVDSGSPQSTSSLPSLSCTEEASGSAVDATTTTTTSTSTSTVSGDCTESSGSAGAGAGTSTSTPPGNPNLPSSTASTTVAATATNTPYQPTTAAPPVATAGAVRGGVVGVAGVVMGWMVVVGFVLGM